MLKAKTLFVAALALAAFYGEANAQINNPAAFIIANGSTIAGGTNTRVLFDDNGVIGESAGLTFTKGNGSTTGVLAIGGQLQTQGDIATLSNSSLFTFGASQDVRLTRDAANTLALRNGTNAQTLNIYGTFTDASNYERLAYYSSGGFYRIEPQIAGTGTGRGIIIGHTTAANDIYLDAGTGRTINFRLGGALAWNISGSGHFVAGTDNTYDIGASGATRPRNLYVAGVGAFGGGNTTSIPALYGAGSTTGISFGAVDVDIIVSGTRVMYFDSAGLNSNVNYKGNVQFQSLTGTAVTAGGAANAGFTIGSTNIGIYFGSGVPTVSAPKGSLYLRSDGTGVADRIYVNTNGSTTWTNLASGA